ncbi:MAG TPA: hypothetical protein VNJ46_10035 [Gaiellaceae bacterium]|nr:hypothetical protein [Gaiellaceae bacterium]
MAAGDGSGTLSELARARGAARVLALAAAAAAGLALVACGGAERSARTEAAPTQPAREIGTAPETRPEPPTAGEAPGAAGELPPPVAKARAAIARAAQALDYDALRALLDPASFSYSFGESGDPVGYWRRLEEEEGHVPILGDILPLVLGGRFATQGDVYVWPAAYAKAPSDWTAEDLEDLRRLYGEEEIRRFTELGAYTGWRVGIREDGAWLFFVAGD